jgi:hypothetical protein
MGFFRSTMFSLAAAACVVAAPASAASLLFNFVGRAITGPVDASFRLDSNRAPDRINEQPAFGLGQIFFDNVPGIFNGNAETATTIAFGTGLAAQFQIVGTSAGFAQFAGPDVFSGTFANPVFTPGTYQFNGFFSNGTLTISQDVGAIPEPAVWGMMLIGFGAVGVGLRSRRTTFRRVIAG